MQYLPNNCRAGSISVFPKNWKSGNANKNLNWRISYWFYDDSLNKKRKVVIKGMNDVETLKEKQQLTQLAINDELEKLKAGYNSILRKIVSPPEEQSTPEMTLETPYIRALKEALDQCELEPHTREDIASMLKYYSASAKILKYDTIPIGEVKRRHIKAILDNCKNLTVSFKRKGKTVTRKKIWNANQFNHYRKYLGIIYNKLERMEVLEYNPIDKLELAEVVNDQEVKKKRVLTTQERERIDKYLLSDKKLHSFRRFVHIFFHSGGRRTELFSVQGKHVDLPGQRYKVLIKKRKKKTWVWKTIKDIALPFWMEALQGCGPEDFVFSTNFTVGARSGHPVQATRWWKKHVKDNLGIQADLYSLKFLHTTEVVDLLTEQEDKEKEAVKAAAEHNSHTTNGMVVKIYDVKQFDRRHNRLKKLNNPF